MIRFHFTKKRLVKIVVSGEAADQLEKDTITLGLNMSIFIDFEKTQFFRQHCRIFGYFRVSNRWLFS